MTIAITLMMKINKWNIKGNSKLSGLYDTYFPFQQEIPNKHIFHSAFLRQLNVSAKNQN